MGTSRPTCCGEDGGTNRYIDWNTVVRYMLGVTNEFTWLYSRTISVNGKHRIEVLNLLEQGSPSKS